MMWPPLEYGVDLLSLFSISTVKLYNRIFSKTRKKERPRRVFLLKTIDYFPVALVGGTADVEEPELDVGDGVFTSVAGTV